MRGVGHGASLAWSPDAGEVLVILMIVKKASDLAFQRHCLLQITVTRTVEHLPLKLGGDRVSFSAILLM
jgi:hypothetical protein